jgi:hypothetical protein
MSLWGDTEFSILDRAATGAWRVDFQKQNIIIVEPIAVLISSHEPRQAPKSSMSQ